MWCDKNKKTLLFVLFLYWLGGNYLVLHAPIKLFDLPNVEPVVSVQGLGSAAESPEMLGETGWQSIALPDDWYLRRQSESQFWYRADIDFDTEPAGIWGAYLPSVTHNAAVYINGVWVGRGGSFEDPVSRHHNHPLLFDFSSSLFQPGTNRIEIRVKASYHEQGLMDQFFIAPVEQLRAAYVWKKFVRVDLIRWVTMGMYLMGLVVFVFWLARPQDKIYGLFSLQLFIWATHNLNLFVFDIPVSAFFWESMTMSTLGWTVVVMIFFNHRYVGEKNQWVERVALVFAVLGMGIFFLPDIGSVLHLGYGVWDGFLIVFGSYAIIHLLRVFWHRQEQDVYLMLLAGIPILIFGFHDILTVNNLRDRREGLTIQYSVIPAILLFSWFLVRRFVQSINHAEHMAMTLEIRVQEKQQEVHEQYQQLKDMEQQQLLSEERERIMRDMHDGIGGQLVSVVMLLRQQSGKVYDQVREKVQLSLTDLRFVIDSLDPVLNDLTTLLGMMRSRLHEQLESAGIELEWDVTELPELNHLSPRRSLHIMRIVQEAVSNAIKHSETNRMKLATSVNDEGIRIEVIDFGRGMATQKNNNHSGRGIDNMKFWAQQIGADLELTATGEGTRVRLSLPIA